MSVDNRVPARSDDEVRRITERTKAEFGVSRRRPVNILNCLESDSVLTLYGRKRLIFLVVNDSELLEAYAKTEFSKGVVTITCRRSVRDRAKMGVGRDRMTLAHELAHAVLHHSVPMLRIVGAAGTTEFSKDGAHTSAEHQAKVFASAFLIHDDHAAEMASAVDISEQFGVSLQAAEICFERLRRKAERLTAQILQMEKGIVKYHLDQLADAGMARCTSSNYNTGHVYWALTPPGRKYAVENKLV